MKQYQMCVCGNPKVIKLYHLGFDK